jgi:hypothetical protein
MQMWMKGKWKDFGTRVGLIGVVAVVVAVFDATGVVLGMQR